MVNVPPYFDNPRFDYLAAQKLQIRLTENVTWIENVYALAKKGIKTEDKETYPIIYANDGSNDTLDLRPDNDLNSYSFFETERPFEVDYNSKEVKYFLNLIVWGDLNRIDNSKEYDFTSELIEEVLNQLKDTSVVKVETRPEFIFNNYTTLKQEKVQYLLKPYFAFKITFEYTLLLAASCGGNEIDNCEIYINKFNQLSNENKDCVKLGVCDLITIIANETELATTGTDFDFQILNEDDEEVGEWEENNNIWRVPNGGIEEIAITVNGNTFATATTSPYDVEVVDSLDAPVGTIGGGKVNIGDATVLVKDSANLTLHTVTVVAEGSENQIVSDSTVLVKNSAGTTLHTTTVKAENTANQTVSDSVININGVNEDIVLAEATFTMFVTVDGVQAGTYDEPTKTVEIVSDVFNKLFFEEDAITTPEVTIDSDSAGTFTSMTNDGSSGTVTIDINGGGFGAFVNPTTLVATDTIQLSRTTTTAIGWGKLIGTK